MAKYKVRVIVEEIECTGPQEAEEWVREKMEVMDWGTLIQWPTYVVADDEPMNEEEGE